MPPRLRSLSTRTLHGERDDDDTTANEPPSTEIPQASEIGARPAGDAVKRARARTRIAHRLFGRIARGVRVRGRP
jgi:hypothetical protein